MWTDPVIVSSVVTALATISALVIGIMTYAARLRRRGLVIKVVPETTPPKDGATPSLEAAGVLWQTYFDLFLGEIAKLVELPTMKKEELLSLATKSAARAFHCWFAFIAVRHNETPLPTMRYPWKVLARESGVGRGRERALSRFRSQTEKGIRAEGLLEVVCHETEPHTMEEDGNDPLSELGVDNAVAAPLDLGGPYRAVIVACSRSNTRDFYPGQVFGNPDKKALSLLAWIIERAYERAALT